MPLFKRFCGFLFFNLYYFISVPYTILDKLSNLGVPEIIVHIKNPVLEVFKTKLGINDPLLDETNIRFDPKYTIDDVSQSKLPVMKAKLGVTDVKLNLRHAIHGIIYVIFGVIDLKPGVNHVKAGVADVIRGVKDAKAGVLKVINGVLRI